MLVGCPKTPIYGQESIKDSIKRRYEKHIKVLTVFRSSLRMKVYPFTLTVLVKFRWLPKTKSVAQDKLWEPGFSQHMQHITNNVQNSNLIIFQA